MSKKIFYCKKWSLGYFEPLDLMSEKQAKKRHDSGKLYTALLGSELQPSFFIQIDKSAKYVFIGFLDHKLREYSKYAFELIDDNTLFFNSVTFRELSDKEGEGRGAFNVLSGITYVYHQNGKRGFRAEKFNPHKMEEGNEMIDMSSYYEKFPEFGEYDSLLRKIDEIIIPEPPYL